MNRNDFYNGQKIDADDLNAIFDYTDDKTSSLLIEDELTTLLGGGGGGILNLITSSLQINGTNYMEIGSNENGTYIKFENGVMMCFISNTNPVDGSPCIELDQYNAGNNMYYTHWVYPATFKYTTPVFIGATGRAGNTQRWPVHTASAMTFAYMSEAVLYCEVDARGDYWKYVIPFAIGFWK